VDPVVVKLPDSSDPLRSTAALIVSSARGIPLWTSRGMLAMAADLAITARVNLEWEEARQRLPMDVVEVVLWSVRETEGLISDGNLPPHGKPDELPGLKAELSELRQVVEEYERFRGGGAA
jgi:hypothetical protein